MWGASERVCEVERACMYLRGRGRRRWSSLSPPRPRPAATPCPPSSDPCLWLSYQEWLIQPPPPTLSSSLFCIGFGLAWTGIYNRPRPPTHPPTPTPTHPPTHPPTPTHPHPHPPTPPHTHRVPAGSPPPAGQSPAPGRDRHCRHCRHCYCLPPPAPRRPRWLTGRAPG